MRILYGINAQQQGHMARAAVLVPRLRERGHTVTTVSSGLPLKALQPWMSPDHLHRPGLPYVDRDGRTDFKRTAALWAKRTPSLLRSRRLVKRLARANRIDAVLSDFELFTGGPSLGLDVPTVSVCRQVALLDSQIPLPTDDVSGRGLTRTVIRLFAMGADRRLAYHLAADSPRCLPPMLRSDLAGTPRREGKYLLVYNSQHFGAGGDADSLLAWSQSRGVPVRAYGFADRPRGQRGGVTFCPPSRETMLTDLAGCRAVASTAGFALPLEAAVLGKPCLTVPLPGQWEQTVNAFQLARLGWAVAANDWDFDAAIEAPTPTVTAAQRDWLLTPVGPILDAIVAALRR